jgi:transposase-like protein
MEPLTANRERRLTFFELPAEHWWRLRTTNVIESLFAAA